MKFNRRLKKWLTIALTALVFGLCISYNKPKIESLLYTEKSSTVLKEHSKSNSQLSKWNSLYNERECNVKEIEKSVYQEHYLSRAKEWSMPVEVIKKHQKNWKSFIKNVQRPYSSGKRGIIYTSYSGVLKQTLISINMLRTMGCELDVEIYYYGTEFTKTQIDKLEAIPGAKTFDLKKLKSQFKFHRTTHKMYEIKGAAILLSDFDQVLYLDSDNIPVRDPTFLFDTDAFKETNAVFWKDFWKTHPDNPIWSIMDIPCRDEFEQDSGQLLVNKQDQSTYQALFLAVYMQTHRDVYFTFLRGDKDTFRFAWKALQVSYHMVTPHVGIVGTHKSHFCGHSMVQFAPLLIDQNQKKDYAPQPLFIHSNLLKNVNFGRGFTFDKFQYYKSTFVAGATAKRVIVGGNTCTELEGNGIGMEVMEVPFANVVPSFESTYVGRRKVCEFSLFSLHSILCIPAAGLQKILNSLRNRMI
jgi:hypothetical protein